GMERRPTSLLPRRPGELRHRPRRDQLDESHRTQTCEHIRRPDGVRTGGLCRSGLRSRASHRPPQLHRGARAEEAAGGDERNRPVHRKTVAGEGDRPLPRRMGEERHRPPLARDRGGPFGSRLATTSCGHLLHRASPARRGAATPPGSTVSRVAFDVVRGTEPRAPRGHGRRGSDHGFRLATHSRDTVIQRRDADRRARCGCLGVGHSKGRRRRRAHLLRVTSQPGQMGGTPFAPRGSRTSTRRLQVDRRASARLKPSLESPNMRSGLDRRIAAILAVLALAAVFVATSPDARFEADDAFDYASAVERAQYKDLLNPYHPIYLPIAKAVDSTLDTFIEVRSLDVLVVLGSMFTAGAIVLFYKALKKWFGASPAQAL